MDFPELNLKGILYCGQCYIDDEVAATNSYRLIRKSSGTYYYLDQRHIPHGSQRQTLPSWLVHRLIFRALSEALQHRDELLSLHSSGIPYKISYPDQRRLDELMSQRVLSISRLDTNEIYSLDRMIQLELDRQQLSYKRGVKICGYNSEFLKTRKFIPEHWEAFEKLVEEVIPQIFVYSDYITIHTTFGIAYDFDIPAKPDKTNDVAKYPMSTFDVRNMFIGEHLKRKYSIHLPEHEATK